MSIIIITAAHIFIKEERKGHNVCDVNLSSSHHELNIFFYILFYFFHIHSKLIDLTDFEVLLMFNV